MPTRKKATRKPTVDLNKALRSWAALQISISDMSAEEVKKALDMEKTGKKRATIIGRLATRYANLQKDEQIKELTS